MIAWSVGMSAPVFDLGITGAPGSHGEPTFETAFSIRDLILIAGGLFLLYKATTEIHGTMQGEDQSGADKGPAAGKAAMGFGAATHQTLVLDRVFQMDSLRTGVGLPHSLP